MGEIFDILSDVQIEDTNILIHEAILRKISKGSRTDDSGDKDSVFHMEIFPEKIGHTTKLEMEKLICFHICLGIFATKIYEVESLSVTPGALYTSH